MWIDLWKSFPFRRQQAADRCPENRIRNASAILATRYHRYSDPHACQEALDYLKLGLGPVELRSVPRYWVKMLFARIVQGTASELLILRPF